MKIRAAIAMSIFLAGSATCAVADDSGRARVEAVMDSVFGPGNWRETGGYRTPSRENELRAQGAMTVPVGSLSRHSMGRPEAPGAYDLVVHGVSPGQAAAKLRRAGAPFQRVLAEAAHGNQGPHLHIEPSGASAGEARHGAPLVEWTVADPTPAQRALALLHAQSAQGQAAAQLRLGEIYASGRGAQKDLVAALVWTALAASNHAADPAIRREAQREMAALSRTMKPEEIALAGRFLRSPQEDGSTAAVGCGPDFADNPIPVLVIQPDDRRPPAPAESKSACSRLASG